MEPRELDEIFAPLLGRLDRLDMGALEWMADAYDRTGDVDTARRLWEMAERANDS
ncbi:hypothetical protein [Nocardia sp. R7R-8]|uniref:hypothetical protein n=1 Tax=Nocardia sp. R7R-8 TaxID=3459304 RepID=UPI00403DBF48